MQGPIRLLLIRRSIALLSNLQCMWILGYNLPVRSLAHSCSIWHQLRHYNWAVNLQDLLLRPDSAGAGPRFVLPQAPLPRHHCPRPGWSQSRSCAWSRLSALSDPHPHCNPRHWNRSTLCRNLQFKTKHLSHS